METCCTVDILSKQAFPLFWTILITNGVGLFLMHDLYPSLLSLINLILFYFFYLLSTLGNDMAIIQFQELSRLVEKKKSLRDSRATLKQNLQVHPCSRQKDVRSTCRGWLMRNARWIFKKTYEEWPLL